MGIGGGSIDDSEWARWASGLFEINKNARWQPHPNSPYESRLRYFDSVLQDTLDKEQQHPTLTIVIGHMSIAKVMLPACPERLRSVDKALPCIHTLHHSPAYHGKETHPINPDSDGLFGIGGYK